MRIGKIFVTQDVVYLEPQRHEKSICLYAQNNRPSHGPSFAVFSEDKDMLYVTMTSENKLSKSRGISPVRLFEVSEKETYVIFRCNEGSGAKNKSKKGKRVVAK